MKKLLAFSCLLNLILFVNPSTAQNKELAKSKTEQAIKLEDEEGKYDEAIALIKEAQKLDPDNIDYPYELAYAYSGKKEYKKASDVLEKLLKHPDVNSRIFQALGNAYDYQGKSDKAITTYQNGLEKFPNAGELYLELGNMKIVKKEYNEALAFYEKGIQQAPQFPSNYYWAAKIFLGSNEEVWGMIYGELFLNLERSGRRTTEISKLLFDTYKKEIKFSSDTSYSVSFSQNATMSVDQLTDAKNFKLPFGMGCYEMDLMMSILNEKQINLASLNNIRSQFLVNYFKGDHSKSYPNALFDYQQKVQQAGHLEAYNYWILMKGEEESFKTWMENNKDKWENFISWYKENKLQLNASNRFYRNQY